MELVFISVVKFILQCLIFANSENVLLNNPSHGSITSSVIVSKNHKSKLFYSSFVFLSTYLLNLLLRTSFSAVFELNRASLVKENGDSTVRSLTTDTLLSYHPGELRTYPNTENQGFYL